MLVGCWLAGGVVGRRGSVVYKNREWIVSESKKSLGLSAEIKEAVFRLSEVETTDESQDDVKVDIQINDLIRGSAHDLPDACEHYLYASEFDGYVNMGGFDGFIGNRGDEVERFAEALEVIGAPLHAGLARKAAEIAVNSGLSEESRAEAYEELWDRFQDCGPTTCRARFRFAVSNAASFFE